MKRYLFFLLLLPASGFSQGWEHQGASGRPLLSAIRDLRTRFNWLITYEEGPYLSENVRLSPENLKVPAVDAVLYKLDELDATAAPRFEPDRQLQTVKQVLLQHNNQNARMGMFGAVRDHNYIFVRPGVWSNDGRTHGYTSLLDPPVFLKPVTEYASLAAMLEDLVAQVATARKVSIGVGMIPDNVFRLQAPLFDIDQGTKARDALVDLFNQANRRFPMPITTAFVWELVFDPNSNGFFFNVATVSHTEDPPAAAIPATSAAAPTTANPVGSKLIMKKP